MVENMSSASADALGLSRAILCNDSLVKKLEELERNSNMYKGLVDHVRHLMKAYFRLARTHRGKVHAQIAALFCLIVNFFSEFGDIFAEIGAREPQQNASEAFSMFGNAHREMEKNGLRLLKVLKPMLSDLNTYLNKAVPDTRLTIKKYLDVKFEYLVGTNLPTLKLLYK